MGWQEAGKLPIVIGAQRPLKMFLNIFTDAKKGTVEDHDNSIQYYLNNPQLSMLLDDHDYGGGLTTNRSLPYLKWRYLDVPVTRYVAVGLENAGELSGLVIGRIKLSRLGKELRITDCFIRHDQFWSGLLEKLIEYTKRNAIDYCTISGLGNQKQNQLVTKFRWKGSFGPTVTIRSLSLTDLGILQNFNQWSPSLGDLELF
jgi:hypothetical protein